MAAFDELKDVSNRLSGVKLDAGRPKIVYNENQTPFVPAMRALLQKGLSEAENAAWPAPTEPLTEVNTQPSTKSVIAGGMTTSPPISDKSTSHATFDTAHTQNDLPVSSSSTTITDATMKTEGGELSTVDFNDCKVATSTLSECKLENVKFAGCRFDNVRFNGQLENVKFVNCKFSNVRWFGIILKNMEFEECVFKDIIWKNVVWEDEYVGTERYVGQTLSHEGDLKAEIKHEAEKMHVVAEDAAFLDEPEKSVATMIEEDHKATLELPKTKKKGSRMTTTYQPLRQTAGAQSTDSST